MVGKMAHDRYGDFSENSQGILLEFLPIFKLQPFKI